MTGKSEYHHGLYFYFSSTNCISISPHTQHYNVVSANLWHSRLGHLSDHILKILSTKLSLLGSYDCNTSCPICPLPKVHCLPFNANNHYCEFPFDLVRCGVWGPFHKPYS